MLEGLKQTIIEFLFPVFCVSCKEEGNWLCGSCLKKEKIVLIKNKAEDPLDGVSAFFSYSQAPILANLIQNFKYNAITQIKEVWRLIIANNYLNLPIDAIIMPVPLYKKRERERGYNQAKIIASLVAEKYNLPLDAASLTRGRPTGQQAKLNRAERQNNVKGAFVWNGAKPAPAKVLLVDDVYTTGATMRECAKVLKQNGSSLVRGVVLALD